MITDTIKYWCDRFDKLTNLERAYFDQVNCTDIIEGYIEPCSILFERAIEDCDHIIVQLLEIYFSELEKTLKLDSELLAAKETIEKQNTLISIYKSKT